MGAFDYKECLCNYKDGAFYCIDAWKGLDENEEGKVVAVVHESGDVYEIEKGILLYSPIVKEVVDDVVRRIKLYGWIKKGVKVRWNDPAIEDYGEDAAEQLNTPYYIMDNYDGGFVDGDTIITLENENGGQVEVYPDEIELF